MALRGRRECAIAEIGKDVALELIVETATFRGEVLDVEPHHMDIRVGVQDVHGADMPSTLLVVWL